MLLIKCDIPSCESVQEMPRAPGSMLPSGWSQLTIFFEEAPKPTREQGALTKMIDKICDSQENLPEGLAETVKEAIHPAFNASPVTTQRRYVVCDKHDLPIARKLAQEDDASNPMTSVGAGFAYLP